MKVVYFGTPSFAAEVLSYLLENGVNVVAVITKPDKPKGRSGQLLSTPVKEIAIAHHIPFYQPEKVSDINFAPILSAYEPDLFIVVAYGEIIKQHLLDMPKMGCINVHASLLPKWRGAAPIQRSILSGDVMTGITIMHMSRKMDAGDMIHKVEVPISNNMTYGELESALCSVGKKALLDVIRQFKEHHVPRISQDHELATLAPKIELEDCEVQWSRSAQDLHNLIRGVNPEPGAWCFIRVKGVKKRLKIISTRIETEYQGPPGSILQGDKNGLIVACGTNALRILDLQLEGKKAMTSAELLRGFLKETLSFQI